MSKELALYKVEICFKIRQYIRLFCIFVFLSVIHTALHIYNFFNFKYNYSFAVPDINLEDTKSKTTLFSFFATSKCNNKKVPLALSVGNTTNFDVKMTLFEHCNGVI